MHTIQTRYFYGMIQPSARLNMLLLLCFNCYLLYYYFRYPDQYGNLLLLYWLQSVVIGFFNWLCLIAIYFYHKKREKEGGETISDKAPVFFFPVHYGIFHLVYVVFIVVQFKIYMPGTWFWLSAAILTINELLDFRLKVAALRQGYVDTSFVFFLPYLRILPMHLALMGASFAILGNRSLFLVLKTLADLAMYHFTNKLYFKNKNA